MAVGVMRRLLARSAPLEDAAAFGAFYERTHRGVFRYVMALCGDAGEAEEIVADAFLRAWRARDRFSGDDDDAAGWIITIARRVAIDRRRAAPSAGEPLPLDEALPDDGPTVDEIIVAADQVETVFALIRRLPERQRDALLLRHLLGWPVKRIARHLDIAENTASVTLWRAIQRVRQGLTAGEGGTDG
jgi:RNA polymerase sigma-70 factor (ECF subfamily)